jgi:UDP-N-acetylglucosamine--N-acetylmuramyl-(pentapeptide) pyrophosphoryl-undecaprenol N-acetylglucosamine transferase
MDNSKKIRVLFTGGGSGGHIYPIIAVAEALRDLAVAEGTELELNYIGPRDKYAEFLADEGIGVGTIASGKLRRYFSLKNLLDIPKVFIGFLQSLFKLLWLMPDVIFSKGGTGALPVVIAGRFYRIPVIIHESDATPGLTNLLSSRFAARIAVSFESALKYFNPKKAAWTGTPIRKELLRDRITKEAAKEELGFDQKEPLILVICGSQGSERINEFVLTNLENLLKESQVLHQTGLANFGNVEKLSRAALLNVPIKTEAKRPYRAVPYLEENLKTALTAADLVVARAGSGTISEISAFAKPSILIPLKESANDHQRLNAYEFAKVGAAIVIEEPNLLPGLFLNQIRSLINNADLLNKMGLASGKFFKPGAAEVIAAEIIRLATRSY